MCARNRRWPTRGLIPSVLQRPDVGVAYGIHARIVSGAARSFGRDLFAHGGLQGTPASTYLKFMSHTCAANLAQFFGIRGRVMLHLRGLRQRQPGDRLRLRGHPAAAGQDRDGVRWRRGDALHRTRRCSTSFTRRRTRFNDRPDAHAARLRRRPRRPGGGRRGRHVRAGRATSTPSAAVPASTAEVLGYGTNCDGTHITSPSSGRHGRGDANARLQDAGLGPERDRLRQRARHGHRSWATSPRARRRCEVLGDRVPVSSTKGHTGHTLGACGALESAFCMAMMREGSSRTTATSKRSTRAARRSTTFATSRRRRLGWTSS